MRGPTVQRICASLPLLLAMHALAQSHRSTHGLPLPPKGYNIAHMIEYAFADTGKALPRRVDLSKHFAPAGDQGEYASCTAWAIGYGIMTYDYNRAHRIRPDKKRMPKPYEVFSPGYLFSMAKRYIQPDTIDDDPCMYGVDLESTFTIASEWGNVPVSICGYAGAMGKCTDSIHINVMDSALYHKLRSPVALYRPCKGCAPFEEGPFYPAQWQFHLAKGEPILVGLVTDDDFIEQGDSAYRTGVRRFVWDRPDLIDGSPHAVVCCGYDNADSTFLFYNSYGTHWGNKGYCRVTARTLKKNCTQAYVFNGGVNETIQPRPRQKATPYAATDTTTSAELKEGHYMSLQGMQLVLADHDASEESALVQVVDSASGATLHALLLHDQVPRAVKIDDRLWIFRFTQPGWIARRFGAPLQLNAEVDRDDDEALEEIMDEHLDRFRSR